jgi:hypothetical protein
MTAISKMSDFEIGLVSGGAGECEAYTQAAEFWLGVVAAAALLGQVEVVIAAGLMAAYNQRMANYYCTQEQEMNPG